MDRSYILDSKDKKDICVGLGQLIVNDLISYRRVVFRSKTKWLMVDYSDVQRVATDILGLSENTKKVAKFFDYLGGVSDLSDRDLRDPEPIARIITDRATGKPSTGYSYKGCKRARLDVNLYRLSERIRPYNEVLSEHIKNVPVTDSKDPKGEWEFLKEQLKSFVTRNFDYGTSLLSSDKAVVDCMIHDLGTLLSDLSDLSDVPKGSTSETARIEPIKDIVDHESCSDTSEVDSYPELERFRPKNPIESYCREWIKNHDPSGSNPLFTVYESDKGLILVYIDGRIEPKFDRL